MGQITVYSKNNCMPCKMTKRFLTEHQVDYREINIDNLPEDEREATIAFIKSEYGVSSLPVTVAEGHEPVAGFAPALLKAFI